MASRSAATTMLLDFISDVSSRFANVTPANTEREIRHALRRILEFFDLDRCALHGRNARSGMFELIYRVDRGRSRKLRDTSNGNEQFPWVFDQVVGRKRTVGFKSLEELPAAAKTDKESFRHWGTRSALLIPILTAGVVDYVVTFASIRGPHAWPLSQIRRLRLLGEIFVGAIRRKTHEVAQAEAQRFEQLVFDLSSGFAGVSWDRIDDQIDLALQELLSFTGVDQCAFFTVFPEKGEACVSYLASHDVTVPVGTITQYAKVTPWLYEKVVNRKEAVFFRRRDELPPEASVDKKHLEYRRTQAALYVPYAVEGVTRYLLAVVSNGGERDWPEYVVERLKVLGTVFMGALNRKAVVAAQMRAQDRLGAVQSFTQATLDALTDYVAVIDSSGTLVETSGHWRTFANGSGNAPESIPVGGNYLLACEATTGSHRDAAVKLAQGIRSVLGGEADGFTMESARLLRSEPRWVHSRVRRFVVDGVVHAAVSHEDITARRKSEQELQDLRARQWHSERITQTGVLIGSIAHELRQPLTAILNNAQAGMRFIARDALDLQEIREILSDIISDAKRSAGIIESLRVTLRRQATKRELVEVADIVYDVIRLLHSEFVRQHIEVEAICAPESVVLMNRAQIQQVVLNLVVNGIDAMLLVAPGQRRLRISVARAADGMLRIGVRDSGAGIAPEALEKAFDAFWTTKPDGTGMGLTICNSIIEAHGGHMWGERNEDAGSTFFFELPAHAQSEPAATGAGAMVVGAARDSSADQT